MVKPTISGNGSTPKKFGSLQSLYGYFKRVPVRRTKINSIKPVKVGSGTMCFRSIPVRDLQQAYESLKGKCAMRLRDAQVPEIPAKASKSVKKKLKKQIAEIKARRIQRMKWLYNSEAETSTFNPIRRYKPCDKERRQYHVNRVCSEIGIDDDIDIINFRSFFDSNYFEFKARGKKGVIGKFQKVKKLAEIYFSCQDSNGELNIPKLNHKLQPYLKGELQNPIDVIAKYYSNCNDGHIVLPKQDSVWKGTLEVPSI